MKGPDVHRFNRRQLLCTTALAFALPLLAAGPASAQANCSVPGVNCALAQDQYRYLQSFASLPNTTAGQALLNNTLSTVINIYQNATTAQRNQASVNANTETSQLQYHLWGMISGLPLTTSSPAGPDQLTALAINASSFQNGSAGATFVPLGAGVASSANLASTMANGLPTAVNNNILSLLSTALSAPQIEAMKVSFGSYNAWYNLGQATPFATYPYRLNRARRRPFLPARTCAPTKSPRPSPIHRGRPCRHPSSRGPSPRLPNGIRVRVLRAPNGGRTKTARRSPAAIRRWAIPRHC